jgi:predicted RNA-binding Zn ribbon-like protein
MIEMIVTDEWIAETLAWYESQSTWFDGKVHSYRALQELADRRAQRCETCAHVGCLLFVMDGSLDPNMALQESCSRWQAKEG